MANKINTDVCIIGGGSAGLSVAAGSSQLGLNTVLIEQDRMGGDCLNTGCIPSKALLAASKRVHSAMKNDIKGIKINHVDVDYAAVKEHLRDIIRSIEPNDSMERFEGLGVTVLHESACFLDSKTLQAGNNVIKPRYVVIATGSSPAIPSIPGIRDVKHYTNENIFELNDKPSQLLIIGGGPVGIEMAQAHRNLGCEVSIFDNGTILPRDDRENVAIIRDALRGQGIKIHEHLQIDAVEHKDKGIYLRCTLNGKQTVHTGSHLLLATGRAPVFNGLELAKAGISFNEHGIKVDKRLRTNNKSIFAIGDVTGGPRFTHIAGYHAGIVIRNICFKIPARVNYQALPWVTYTDPEIAQVGLTYAEANKKYNGNIKSVSWSFEENDRAITECTAHGRIRLITNRQGRILGASIVGPQAGELIQLWGLAISSGLKIGSIANMISPYPTLGEINKRAAAAWYTDTLFSSRTRKLVKLLQKLPL